MILKRDVLSRDFWIWDWNWILNLNKYKWISLWINMNEKIYAPSNHACKKESEFVISKIQKRSLQSSRFIYNTRLIKEMKKVWSINRTGEQRVEFCRFCGILGQKSQLWNRLRYLEISLNLNRGMKSSAVWKKSCRNCPNGFGDIVR